MRETYGESSKLSSTQNGGCTAVNALLLALHVWEVWNFDLWEQERMAKEVPAQDWVVKGEMDCFRDSVAR